MTHWVYIYEDNDHVLRIGISGDVSKVISNLELRSQIVYLRSFEFPFDALAHKYLLEDLSNESVWHMINKHKDATKKWLVDKSGR